MTEKFNRANSHGCPCQDCEEREIGCHGQCERYKAWRVVRDGVAEVERKTKDRFRTQSERSQRNKWKRMRYGNQNYRRSRGKE